MDFDHPSSGGNDAPAIYESGSPRPLLSFDRCSIGDLENAPRATLDSLPFGVVGMDAASTVDIYSAAESRMAGLSPERVMGKHMFTAVAPCMNNYLVAQRFEEAGDLDATIDYVLTLRMKPTPVKIRMLKSEAASHRYLLIQR